MLRNHAPRLLHQTMIIVYRYTYMQFNVIEHLENFKERFEAKEGADNAVIQIENVNFSKCILYSM